MITRIVPSYETCEFDAKKNRYCICVFVINEGEKLLNQLKTMSGICDGLVDIVVADGGSTDGSTDHDKLKALGVNTLLVKTGGGKLGSQMRMAFDWALNRGYEGVVVVDGNGKDGMDAIPRFVDELKKGVDHVQGSRFIKGGYHENTPKSRLWGLKLLHVPLMRLASGYKYTDTTNGFRAYSARLLSSDKLNIFRSCFAGYELHYYLAIEAARQGFQCAEIPVSRVYPANGKIPTKISGIKGNALVLQKLFACCLHLYATKKTMYGYIKNYIVSIISIIFLFFAYQSFYHNRYAVVEDEKFEKWEKGSENLVVQSKIDPETREEKKWYSLYPMAGHYIGAQGIADSFICHLFEDAPLDKKIEILKKIEVILTVIALSYLCYWVGTELSLAASILFAFFAIHCQFIVISTRNLYWSMWTMYLPLALFLYLLRKEENKISKKGCIVFSYLLAVATMLFVRFATMFEYSSSMMVLTELPLLYYGVKNKWSSKKYFLNALWTGIIDILVFIFSFLILYTQILVYRANCNFMNAWELATANIRYRTGVGGWQQENVYILNSFLSDLESIYERYLDFSAFVWNYNEYNVSTIVSWSFILFFIGILMSLLAKQIKPVRKYIAFGSFAFLAMMLQIIWIITAKGHSYIHFHINWILWNIPMLLMAALIGYTFSILLVIAYKNLKSLRKNIYTWILTCATLLGVFAFYFLYQKSNFSGFDIIMKKIEVHGTSIADSDVRYIILPQMNKIYLRIPNGQAEAYRFFYHIYPLHEVNLKDGNRQYNFNNLDFSIKNKSDESFVRKSPFSHSKYEIIQCQLPSYPYVRINIGQFESNKRFWTLELKNEMPEKRSYMICNLSDGNWTSGVNNSNKKCLLFYSSQHILKGDYVIFPNGTINRVEKTEQYGQYLYVFIDKEAPSLDPNQPCVFSKTKPDALLMQETEAQPATEQERNEKPNLREEIVAGTKQIPPPTQMNPEEKAKPAAVSVATAEEAEKLNAEAMSYAEKHARKMEFIQEGMYLGNLYQFIFERVFGC